MFGARLGLKSTDGVRGMHRLARWLEEGLDFTEGAEALICLIRCRFDALPAAADIRQFHLGRFSQSKHLRVRAANRFRNFSQWNVWSSCGVVAELPAVVGDARADGSGVPGCGGGGGAVLVDMARRAVIWNRETHQRRSDGRAHTLPIFGATDRTPVVADVRNS